VSVAGARRPDLASEKGFSLIELLVALVAGLVVMGALYAILEVSLHQTSHLTDRVSADQRGRLTMEKVMQIVQSSCVAPNYTPIEPNSTGSELRIVSAPLGAKGATAALPEVNMHVLALSGETLADTIYPSTAGSTAPNWTFSAKATKESPITLLKGVSQSGSTPVFQYYGYEGSKLSTTPLAVPLSEVNANKAASVTVTYVAKPETGNVTVNRTLTLTDTAVLRFAPASTTSNNTPCT
jgi:prepilin-type N-terminal cleavage/methylation domain-containing protein